MKTERFSIAVLVAACIFAPLSTSLAADTHIIDGARARVVEYRAVDLTETRAAETLYRNIALAARAVCDMPNARSASARSRIRTCTALSVERAVSSVDAPILTTIHLAKTGRPLTPSPLLAHGN